MLIKNLFRGFSLFIWWKSIILLGDQSLRECLNDDTGLHHHSWLILGRVLSHKTLLQLNLWNYRKNWYTRLLNQAGLELFKEKMSYMVGPVFDVGLGKHSSSDYVTKKVRTFGNLQCKIETALRNSSGEIGEMLELISPYICCV